MPFGSLYLELMELHGRQERRNVEAKHLEDIRRTWPKENQLNKVHRASQRLKQQLQSLHESMLCFLNV